MIKLLYPDRCPICQEISNGICCECKKKISYVEEPCCFRCGKPLAEEETEYCLDCRQYRHVFEQGKSLFLYQDSVRESIHRIKYQNKREYLDTYAREIAEKMGRDIRKWNADILIPIPMDRKKMRQRGYNQAEILAEKLSVYLRLPVGRDVLKKVRRTCDQKELTHQQRRSNLKNAFAVNECVLDSEDCIPWKRVLLIDDVYTTGSTIDAASDVLKRYGAEEIYFITICIGEGAS